MAANGLDLLGLGHAKWPIKDTIKALRDFRIEAIGFLTPLSVMSERI